MRLPFFAVALLVCAAAPALAQDPTTVARDHFKAAEAAEKRGDYERALTEYVAAYEAKPHPAVLYNIATIYERLGQPEEAARFYQQYLDERPDAPDGAAVQARMAGLRSRPSKLTIESDPPGARILLDGAYQCDTPCELRVAAGAHEVSGAFAQGTPQRKRITAEFGKPQSLHFAQKQRNGRLTVRTVPEGAQVFLDGTPVGSSPIELEAPVGNHHVSVRASGFRPKNETVEVLEGQGVEVAATLTPLHGQRPEAADIQAPPRILPPPAPDGEGARQTTAHWLYGVLGGPNALHPDSSWGGGFSLAIQSGGEGVDLEAAILLPVFTLELDVRWYLATHGVFRPFILVGGGVVSEKSDSSSMTPDSTPVVYMLNAGAGFSIDLGAVAFYFEGLANGVLTSQPEDRFSVPVLAGMYFRR
jgi:hypothetical protein